MIINTGNQGPNRDRSDEKGNPVAQNWLAYNGTVCYICLKHIVDPCMQCDFSTPPNGMRIECDSVTGICGHVFHYHCILRWLDVRYVCPIDNLEWDFTSP